MQTDVLNLTPLNADVSTLHGGWKNMAKLYEKEHPAAHSPMVAVLFWTLNHWAYIVHVSIFSITLFWEAEACTKDLFSAWLSSLRKESTLKRIH